MITALTLFNTLALLYLVSLRYIKLGISRNTVSQITVGFHLMQGKPDTGCSKSFFYLPIRNYKKVETRAEVKRLKASYPNHRQPLRAMFSWLKTSKEVQEFQSSYECVDKEFVAQLVQGFKPETQL